MRTVRARDVLPLAEVTAAQLREWAGRRAIIPPDLPPRGRGSEARFMWQTVLLIRLAVVLRRRFHLELGAHRDLLHAARMLLARRSFPSLWGSSLAIYDLNRCEILTDGERHSQAEDVVLLRLDRHLHVLSRAFGLPEEAPQLPLFPAVLIKGGRATTAPARLLAGVVR